MTRRVTPGEPILPHMTAKWFNKTLQDPQQKPLPPGKEERKHNETKATFIPTELCAKALRFTAVAPVGRVDTYGNRVERAQYVDKGSLTKYNWMITQLEMAQGFLTQDCVYAGITYAKVNILSSTHKYVDLNLETLELESSNSGKGLLLDVGSEYSLISIETFIGIDSTPTTTTQPLSPIDPVCLNECKWEATSELDWNLAEDNCIASTTSTTSSTTSSTSSTTTYDGYSLCKGTTSTPSPPEDEDCNCLYPLFCPTATNQCTFTSCSTGTNSPPVCSSTTTSTTTSCDCNTTTTGPGCNCGFIQVQLPDGTVVQQQVGSCPPGCQCIASITIEPCDPDPCSPDNLTGRCVCPEPPPPCPECSGSTWLWCDYNCDGELVWKGLSSCGLDRQGCLSDSECLPASAGMPCTVCGEFLLTGCYESPLPISPTTTTPAPDCCLGPCSHCYGCPSTTTSTSTTTTDNCSEPCTRRWNGSVWNIIHSNCPSPCYCGGVPYSGRDTCEVVQVPCITPPTTTTTTTSTTSSTSSTTSTTTSTSTSSTSSTTTCERPDDCASISAITCTGGTDIVWTCSLDGTYAWRILGGMGDCSDQYSGCFNGPAPSCDCSASNVGQTRTGDCCQTTTTTTSSTSTTTTASCILECPEGYESIVNSNCFFSCNSGVVGSQSGADDCGEHSPPGGCYPPTCPDGCSGTIVQGICCVPVSTTTSTSTTTTSGLTTSTNPPL
jgi:hypothetical protein